MYREINTPELTMPVHDHEVAHRATHGVANWPRLSVMRRRQQQAVHDMEWLGVPDTDAALVGARRDLAVLDRRIARGETLDPPF